MKNQKKIITQSDPNMKNYKLSKDWIEKNRNKIKEAYITASIRGFDISLKDDVFKLLKIIDPENACIENADVFSRILQLFSNYYEKGLIKN